MKPVPQKPESKKKELKKDEPKKKEHFTDVRPNFLLCAVFQALNLLIIIAIFVIVLGLVGIDLKKDFIDILLEAFNNLVVTSEDVGGVPMFGMLLGQMRDTLVFTFIQIVVLALILQIPVVNNHWRLFSDRLEYKKGFILLKTKTVLFSDVKNVSFKSYTPFADFGKVTVEFSGGEGKDLTMPYAFHASKLTAELNNKVKQHQMDKVATLAKKSQAPTPPVSGQIAAKKIPKTVPPSASQPQGPKQ